MDGVNAKETVLSLLRRYRYVILVVAVGFVLMTIPSPKKDTVTEQPQPVAAVGSSPQEELAEILAHIHGVGKVRVLLTESAGALTLYEIDEDRTEGNETSSIRSETVIVTDDNRTQQGLIRQVIPPVYQGAVVVCQGGDIPSVRLAVVEAVAAVTGLTTDKISVLKMK